jgi:hypothetical protein
MASLPTKMPNSSEAGIAANMIPLLLASLPTKMSSTNTNRMSISTYVAANLSPTANITGIPSNDTMW